MNNPYIIVMTVEIHRRKIKQFFTRYVVICLQDISQ